MAEGFDGAKSAVTDKMDTLKDRAFDAASAGKNQLADSIDKIGDTIDERISVLEQEGGVAGKAAPIIQKASSAVDATAEYLRNNELDAMRDDLVTKIRERPLLSVGIAFGAGVVFGKLFGGRADDEEDRPRKRSRSGRSSFLKSQLAGPVGAALMTTVTGMIASEVRERVAGASGKTEA